MATITAGLRQLALSSFIAATVPVLAHAADPGDVAERLQAVMAEQGVAIEWSAVSGDGEDEVRLEGVTVTQPGQPAPNEVGDIVLSDITEDGDIFRAESMEMTPGRIEAEDVGVTIGRIEITGLVLPPVTGSGDFGDLSTYDSATIESVEVVRDGKQVFSLANATIELDVAEDDSGLSFTGNVESFEADLTAADDPNTTATATALGYAQIGGSMEFSGAWDAAAGRAAIDQYDITVDDAGTIGFTIDIGGYTPEVAKAMRETQAKLATANEQEQQMQGMAMLGIMQQLNLHSATIRFDDDTLTEKVLGFVAAMQGAQPRDIANQAKAVLPFMLGQLGSPELTATVSAAVNDFLDNPESLEIAIQPENPVPLAMIAAGAMTAPQALPQQLRLKVTANE